VFLNIISCHGFGESDTVRYVRERPMSNSELPDNPGDRVSWVIGAPDQAEMRRRYDLWAKQYDADLGNLEDYLAPRAMAGVAKTFLSRTDRILDAGAGTGLSGAALQAAGFGNLVAADYSAGMLEIAATKNIYQETLQADFGARTPFADDAFDAVVTVGTTSQMPAESLREYVRIVRPGGRILFTVWVKPYVERGYAAIQQSLEAAGRLALIHKGEPFQALPTTEPDMWYEVWVFDVHS
jgi:SAM-dependent methyltransferase